MKRFSIKFISAVLSVLMLLSMVSCIFGLSASAEEMERDSGNMPLWFFDPDVMDTEKDDVRTFSDGSIRYTRTHKNDFGTALINDFVEFDFKSNSHWALTLRADSEISEGYVIGGNPSGIFIKKVDSTNALAYCEEGRYSMVSSGIWHRMRIDKNVNFKKHKCPVRGWGEEGNPYGNNRYQILKKRSSARTRRLR